MARLNDAAAPIDPVELLRRKYSRQNKEIARINSTQCIRIRNLENEVSRLLAENLGLREKILRLQSEADLSRGQHIFDHVSAIKSSLEAKLLELGAIVTNLGDQPAPLDKASKKEGKRSQASPTQSPDQRNWKNMCTLSEAAGLQDGRLPPILENKYYPRRTLETAEITDILSDPVADNSESPDIGPPPVSKFINEDPVKIDFPGRDDADGAESSAIDATSSINLEQRRKRRDSAAPPERNRVSRCEPNSKQPSREVAQSLKTGAKRKLSIRDDDDGISITKVAESSPDDFKYTRRNVEEQGGSKTSGATEKHINKTTREFAIARGVSREMPSSSVSTTGRKALGPKTTNTDVVNSPKKSVKSTTLEDISSDKRASVKRDQPKERTRERRTETVVKPRIEPVVAVINPSPEPETPAPPELFSPPASGSSVAYAESRDTPPPSDLGPGNEGQRPSRRARASVSYVQPNLRDKMRRQTKDFVDAVTGEGKAQRLSMVKLENDAPTTAGKIKEEPEADDSWKTMPSAASVSVYSKSPLGDKAMPRDPLAGAVITQRQRRRSSMHPFGETEQIRSGSSAAISALISGSRKVKPESHKVAEQHDSSLNKAMAQLDIYEFTGSSPREATNSMISTVTADWHTSRSARRLSSQINESNTGSTTASSDSELGRRNTSTSSRRRESMLGVRGSISDTDAEDQHTGDMIRRSNSHSILSDGGEGTTRNERMSARRRSMML